MVEETVLSMVEETGLSMNNDTEDDDATDDNDESESSKTPPNTPSLMKEIQDVIDRDEVGIFTLEVDEPEPDSEIDDIEKPNDAEKKEELEKVPEGNAKEEEEEVSDSESTSTVEYTRSEQTERLRDLEQEKEVEDAIEVVTIGDEPDENSTETPERDTENEANKEVVINKVNTKGLIETDNLEEVINQEGRIEGSNKSQGRRTPTRS